MSGPHGSDSGQQWQPPGPGGEQPSSEQPTQVGSPWQQQQPPQDATWQAPAYTPPADYPRYQQPAEQPYPQQYPPAAPGYGQPAPGQYPQPGQYAQPGQYGQPGQPAQYGQPGQYPQQYPTYEQPAKKRPSALIVGIIAAVALVLVAIVLVTGFWAPGFFVTTKLDVNKAQSGVQQVLTTRPTATARRTSKTSSATTAPTPPSRRGRRSTAASVSTAPRST
jgi:hypothetical protein